MPKKLFGTATTGPMQPDLAAPGAALILDLDSNERMRDIAEARLQADRQLYP